VVLIIPAHKTGMLNLYPPILTEFVFAMERECARSNLRLHLTGFYPHDRDQEGTLIRELRSRKGDFGHVFVTGVPDMHPAFRRIIGEMALQRKPLAVVDDIGGFHFELPTGAPAALQVFRPMGAVASREMTRLLLDKGHKQIAYLSCQHRHAWSTLRWQGIQQACARVAGSQCHLVADSQLQDKFDLAYAACDYPIDLFREIFGAGRNDLHLDIYSQQRREARRADVLKGLRPDEMETLRQGLSVIRRYWKRRPPESFFSRFRDFIMEHLGVIGQAARLRDQFERALHLPGVTAWVCANDATAIAALDFLRERKIDVPGQISLVGFDDAPEAQNAGLTSYVFRADLLAHRVSEWLAHPLPSGVLQRRRAMEVPGEPVLRGTVAVPRKTTLDLKHLLGKNESV